MIDARDNFCHRAFMPIGSELKEMAVARGIRAKQIADGTKLTTRTIRRVYNDTAGARSVQLVAGFLGLSVDCRLRKAS